MTIINTKIMGHWLNWVIVLAIAIFWLLLFDFVQAGITGRHPGSDPRENEAA